MKKGIKNDEFVAGVIYNSALEEEMEWRKDKKNKHDVELTDSLISKINELGYNFQYYTDLTNRDIRDKNLLPILKDMLPKFDSPDHVSFLIGLVSFNEFIEATTFVLEMFRTTRNFNPMIRYRCGVMYDNALCRIKDKRYIRDYLEFLNDEVDANNLPLTMRMIAEWQVPEAKPVFIKYLNTTGELLFTAIDALSYYKDLDCVCLIEPFLKSKDKNIVKCAKKAIDRLKKHQY